MRVYKKAEGEVISLSKSYGAVPHPWRPETTRGRKYSGTVTAFDRGRKKSEISRKITVKKEKGAR